MLQISRRFGIAPPIEVRFDDYTVDITENRLLKAALYRLHRLGLRSPSTRSALRRFEAELANVSLDPYLEGPPAITFNRLTEHYRPAVELARLILRNSSLELTAGDESGTAVLLDMPGVFENFVHAALRESLRLSPNQFPQGDNCPALHLDRADKVRLRPDLSWWEGTRCRFVGDVKYKRTDDAVNHPDLYQLLAYTTATNLSGGLLIYAAGEVEPTTHQLGDPSRDVLVRTLQINGHPSSILDQIDELAHEVRQLRYSEPAVGPRSAGQRCQPQIFTPLR